MMNWMDRWEWTDVFVCSQPSCNVHLQGCPGWHSARSVPEGMTITNTVFPSIHKMHDTACPLPAGAKGLCPVGDHRVELARERASQQRASLLSSRSVSNGPGQANE